MTTVPLLLTQHHKKIQQEKKPRFTKQELSQFSQTQVDDIIGKIRKEGKFTIGEKEIKTGYEIYDLIKDYKQRKIRND